MRSIFPADRRIAALAVGLHKKGLVRTLYLQLKKLAIIKKNPLKEAIKSIPDEFTLEELVDKLVLLDKIEKGNRDSIEGNTVSEVELEEEMKKWFK